MKLEEEKYKEDIQDAFAKLKNSCNELENNRRIWETCTTEQRNKLIENGKRLFFPKKNIFRRFIEWVFVI